MTNTTALQARHFFAKTVDLTVTLFNGTSKVIEGISGDILLDSRNPDKMVDVLNSVSIHFVDMKTFKLMDNDGHKITFSREKPGQPHQRMNSSTFIEVKEK